MFHLQARTHLIPRIIFPREPSIHEPRVLITTDRMVYQPDDPDLGNPHTIKLITENASRIPIFESLRHNRPAPDAPSPAPISRRPQPPARAPLPFNQHVVQAPTDAECGLPDLYTSTLADIPSESLPLSKYLSRGAGATILHGYTRAEIAVSLAHALNLRRCNAGARAVLLLATSEAAVREWTAALCPALDEIQLISYSRGKLKREATLVRLRETQFPGVVVAAEKAARDGMPEIWGALRENRLIRKWDLVVSEAVSDANVEGVCSPLRMVRDGTAEFGLVLENKPLSRAKATAVVRGVEGVDIDNIWVRKKDVPDIVERFEKRDERAGKKVGHTPEGKENRASLRNRDIVDAGTGGIKELQTSQGPVTSRRRSNSRVVKPARGKEPSLRATTRLPTAVTSRTQSMADDANGLASGTDSSTDLKRSNRIPVRAASGRTKTDDSQGERTGRVIVGPVKRRKPYNRIAPELLSQSQGSRRRTPRSSSPTSDETSGVPRSKPQPKQRRSTKSESIQEPIPVLPVRVKRADSRSRGSSSSSVVLSKTEMTNEDDGNTTSSRAIRDKVLKRARALGIYDTSSGDDTFYTPPTHAMPPKSDSPSSDEYHTPRTSFSPKAATDPSKSRRNSPIKIASQKGSASRAYKRERAKSASTRYASPKAKAAPLKIGGSGTKTRLNFSDSDSSDDEPLSRKIADITREERRQRSNTFLAPDPARKKSAVRTSSEAQEGTRIIKRRSVFDRLGTRSQKNSGVTRRHSFAGPLRVKDETDIVSGERPPGLPRHSTEARNRRRSLQLNYSVVRDDRMKRSAKPTSRKPRYSNVNKQSRRSSLPSSGSTLPSKRPSLENRGTLRLPSNLSQVFSSASRAHRASLDELRRRTPPAYKTQNRELASKSNTSHPEAAVPSISPVRKIVPNASRVSPEVIIISDSEEETAHNNVSPTKRRRLFGNAESTRDTRRNETVFGTSSGRMQDMNSGPRRVTRRSNTRVGTSNERIQGQNDEPRRGRRRNDTGAGTSSRRIQDQNRTEPSDQPQTRSLRSSGDTSVTQEEDLGAFIRNINRRRQLSGLTSLERKKYNEHLKRAKRNERMNRMTEAIESYQKCRDIYDGDTELTDRFLALSSHQGYFFPGDFSSQPARSPIKKQPRRRRNPVRTARVERSISRVEVIDLTSS